MLTSILIKIKLSNQLTAVLGLLHLGVLMWLWLSAIPWWLTTLGCVSVVASFYTGFKRNWQPTSGLQAITYHPDQTWTLQIDQQTYRVSLVRPVFICPWWVIIYFKGSDQSRYGCLIANDMLSHEQYSRLRVCVNWLCEPLE